MEVLQFKSNYCCLLTELFSALALRSASHDRCVRSTLSAFLKFHNKTNNQEQCAFLTQCTPDHIVAYMNHIQSKPGRFTQRAAAGSVAAHYKRLKAVFVWLKMNGYRPDSPIERVLFRSHSEEIVHPTGFVPYDRIWPEIDKELASNTVQGLAFAAAFVVLFFTGCRRSECLQLRIEDLSETDGVTAAYFRHTKGGRSRYAPISDEGAPVLRLYLKQLNAMGKAPAERLFDFCPNLLYKRFFAHFGCGPHAARATFVTLMAQRFGSGLAQEAAGIENSAIVRRYIKRRQNLSTAPAAKLNFK